MISLTAIIDGQRVTRYRETIEWTIPGGGRASVEGPLADSPEGAMKAARTTAEIYGWRRPRLLEWWRWRDRRYDRPRRARKTDIVVTPQVEKQ